MSRLASTLARKVEQLEEHLEHANAANEVLELEVHSLKEVLAWATKLANQGYDRATPTNFHGLTQAIYAYYCGDIPNGEQPSEQEDTSEGGQESDGEGGGGTGCSEPGEGDPRRT